MTDPKIKLHFSLASRVVLVVCLLLVLPLLMQSVFLYKQEYRQKEASIRTVLLLVARERIERIRETPDAPISKWTAPDTASPYPIHFSLSDRPLPADAVSIELPLPNSSLSLVASLPHTFLRSWHHSEYFARLVLLLFFVGVLGGGAVLLLIRRIAKPMRKLCETLQRVSEGAVHIRYTPDRMGFEINQLGKQFNQTLDQVLHHQEEAQKERVWRERLAEELRIGHDIQKSLLPTHIPEGLGLDLAPGYLPAKEVSGDFYDLWVTPQGELLLLVVDVAGKGIAACLHALGLRSAIRSMAAITSDLERVVIAANDLFWADTKNSGMFATAWIGLYDPKQRVLRYASQGHPPALLEKRGHWLELGTGGMALGAQQLDAVTVKTVDLAPGDLLCLYTDGVLEAHDPDDRLFGKKRFQEFLSQNKKELPEQIVQFLLEEIELFAQGKSQHDDITLLISRCK